MEYNKIVAVTGLSGLYEMVGSKADGGIVRSLEDKSTKFVSNRMHNFSQLESIEVYTVKDNVNLAEVFMAMKNSDEKAPDHKADQKAIRSYFEKVFPEIDFERVYASDMKKMIRWFSILNDAGIEIKLSEENSEDAVEVEKKNTAAKNVEHKAAAVKNAPAKKINTPRKMA